MVKAAFTHSNKRIVPVNETVYERDEEIPAPNTVTSPVEQSQQATPQPQSEPQQQTVTKVEEPQEVVESTEQESDTTMEGVRETKSPYTQISESTPTPEPQEPQVTVQTKPSPSDQLFEPTVQQESEQEEPKYVHEEQLPRRVSGRSDEETFRALRMLALDENKPLWLVVATILRDAVVEHRKFEPSHIPGYTRERGSYKKRD